MRDVVRCLLEFGPFVVLLVAWIKLSRRPKLSRLARAALIIATLNSALSAWWFLYYTYTLIRPPKSFFTRWQDLSDLSFALLFFLAPVAAIVALCAMGIHKPKKPKPPAWLWFVIYSTSFVLFMLGVMAGLAD
ncbi:MAG TPA: hypothetical protein VFW25_06155 [Silvibacterium sp.]|nr:hypothetical protein [Silvibacterium sp.]